MKKALLIYLILLFYTGLYLPAQNPYIHQYTTFDGLPTNVINGIFQDSRKFIWFATDAGAVRYDGSDFKTFTKNDGLNSNIITKIKEDSSGRIWIINYNGSVNFYRNNKIYNSADATFLDSLNPGEAFSDFFEDDNATIYFYNPMYEVYALDSNDRVRKFEQLIETLEETLVTKDGKKATGPFPRSYTSSFPNFIMANLYQIRKTSAGDYIFWSKYAFFKMKEIFRDPVLVQYNYRCYLRSSCEKDGDYYILAFGRYIKKYNEDQSDELIKLPGDIYIGYTLSRQNSLLADRQGYYWVGTFDKGLYCYEEDTIIQQRSEPNIPAIKSSKLIRHLEINRINGLIQDHEGNIWVSSSVEGVFKISPDINRHRHYSSELFGNKGVIELVPGLWNGIWLSAGKNVYFLKDDSIYDLDYHVDYISLFNVIYHLQNNKLILGEKYSEFYLLNELKPDSESKKVLYRSADTSTLYMSGLSVNAKENKINCFNYFNFDLIHPDTLFGQYASGFFQKDFNVGSRITYTYYNVKDELIAIAKKNYIQVNDTFEYYSELSRFDNRIITQHINLDSETELFNIENDSLYLLHDHQFYSLTEAFATPADLNISSVSYEAPVLYMANAGNIYYCNNPLDLILDKPVELKLTDFNFKNIHKILACNHSLYIASDDGLTVIPDQFLREIIPQAPLPYIQSVLVNDMPADFSGKELSLKGRNSLKFNFSSISYSSTPVIYSYILEGADEKWSSGTGNIVSYQKLPFGKYIFRLKVGKPNMAWSEPIELKVNIRPRFWQHPLFIAFICLIFIGLIVLYLFRRANNRLKQQETEHQLILLEQKALQSMMNPHFIFNTLGSIQNFLLQNKPGEAGIYLSQFARLIRLNIGSINSPLINLEEEVNRLRIYLDLEKFRMANKFDYRIEYDPGIEEEDIFIPSMIIQPFVENSVWHGISPLEEQGLIRVIFSPHSDKAIKVIIEDNGIGMGQSAKYSTKDGSHLHLSMDMVRKRLEIIGKKMNVKTSMEIDEAFPGEANPGTRVEIVVPVGFDGH